LRAEEAEWLHGKQWSEYPRALSPSRLMNSVVWADSVPLAQAGSCQHLGMAAPGTAMLSGRRYARTRAPIRSDLLRVQVITKLGSIGSGMNEIISLFSQFSGAVGDQSVYFGPRDKAVACTLAGGNWRPVRHFIEVPGAAPCRLPVHVSGRTWLLTMDHDGSRTAMSAVSVLTSGFGAGGTDPAEPPVLEVEGGNATPAAAAMCGPAACGPKARDDGFAAVCNRELCRDTTTHLLAFKVCVPQEEPTTPEGVAMCLAACPPGSVLLGGGPMRPVLSLATPPGWTTTAGIGTLLCAGWRRRARLVAWRTALVNDTLQAGEGGGFC